MRAIWKGAITFGLVNVPIRLYSATEDHDVDLHQVHDKDGGRIRYQRRCEKCGKVVEYAHIDKAFAEGSTTVVLTEEDLKSLPEERSREIEVVEFVPSEQIDPIMFDRSYFLEPEKTAVKAYALLRRTLEETDRTAIVQFSLRQKTRLGALRARDKVLMLQSLLWDDEVREADFGNLDSDVRVSAQELKMSASLVDNMSTDFAPDKFSDEYQEQLRQLIAAKLEKGDALDTAETFGEEPEKTSDADVIDLMEALRQSVERNRAARAGQQTTAAKSGGSAAAARGRPRRRPTRNRRRRRRPARKLQRRKHRPRRAPGRQRRRAESGPDTTGSRRRRRGSRARPGFTPYPEARQARPGPRGESIWESALGILLIVLGAILSVRAELGHPVRLRRHARNHPAAGRRADAGAGAGSQLPARPHQARPGEPIRRAAGRLIRRCLELRKQAELSHRSATAPLDRLRRGAGLMERSRRLAAARGAWSATR